MSIKTKDEILNLFKEKDYLLNMGAGKLANYYGCSKDLIYECKDIIRNKQNNNISKLPKILILDIETAPLKGYVWQWWKQNINYSQQISNFFMITWAAKWLYTSNVMSDKLTSEEAIAEDDKRIVTSLHSLLDEADMVIAHNGNSFDLPKIRTRCLLNGLRSNLYYTQIDTKVIAAKQFGFDSNSLNALARQFGISTKHDTDMNLWIKCVEGDDEALSYMEYYNKHDVEILEEVYLTLRPWIRNHPNLNMYNDTDECGCGNCGHSKLTQKGFYYTQSNRYKTYVCDKCGALNRTRIADKFRDKNNLLIPVAK